MRKNHIHYNVVLSYNGIRCMGEMKKYYLYKIKYKKLPRVVKFSVYVQILCYRYIRVCIHVDLWSSEAAGVCRDTRNALLSPARLRIPIQYLVHLTIYSCLGFFILILLLFFIFSLLFFPTMDCYIIRKVV